LIEGVEVKLKVATSGDVRCVAVLNIVTVSEPDG